MLVDWKYAYKRRQWSVDLIINGLSEKTWKEFQNFHKQKGIVCPPKHLFDSALSLSEKTVSTTKPKVETKTKVQRKKRTYTRKKGDSGARGKETKK